MLALKRPFERPQRHATLLGVGIFLLTWAAPAALGGGIELQPKAGEPLNGLTVDQLDRFFKGKVQFSRTINAAEGLGPTFNQNSCSSCHVIPVGGSGTVSVTRFGYTDKMTGEFDPLEHLGGSLLQAQLLAHLPPECADELPEIRNEETLRITNSTLGIGLVESIEDQVLIDHAATSVGRVHMVEALEDPPGSPLRVGRMGWKAQVATVLTFSADASRNEMGFTNRLIVDPPAPKGDESLLELCDEVENPNDGPDSEGFHFIDRITDFQRYSAAPPQTPRSGMTGETIFNNIGCGDCHVGTWTTADDPALEDALRNRVIKPYSDFLLHDMGLLGDGIAQGDAGQREFRTPALWGLRLRDPMLHDGRAGGGTFEERLTRTTPGDEGVIWWHMQFLSSAQESAQKFFNELNATEQAQLVAFLDSLGRAEFDYTGNNVIDDDDFLVFVGCFTGSGATHIHPDDHCAIGDINQDGAIDELDFHYFLMAYEGEQEPCDMWTYLADNVGPGVDVVLPKECQKPGPTCPGDLNGDSTVNVGDLLVLLAAWGPCPGCDEDLNSDNVVNVGDMLVLLGNWGMCDDGGGEPKPIADDSCEGRCGEQTPDGCWCDDLCSGYGDCCVDACEHCDQCDASCFGQCGEQTVEGCWCDDLCAGYGDCCNDVCNHCPELDHCE